MWSVGSSELYRPRTGLTGKAATESNLSLRVPAQRGLDMRGASVSGHAGWCHTELSVLGGYWRRVTAVGCCGPGIAGIVIGPPAAGLGQACQTARMAGASAAAWARPAGSSRPRAQSTSSTSSKRTTRGGRSAAVSSSPAIETTVDMPFGRVAAWFER